MLPFFEQLPPCLVGCHVDLRAGCHYADA
jgi:hypothetical protein